MPMKAEGKIYENSQERYFSTCSRLFFWFLVVTGAINGTANLYIWHTDQAEIIPPVIRGCAGFFGVFNLVLFTILLGAGLIRLRGSTSSLTRHDWFRIIVFFAIVIAPFFFWAIRSDVANAPLAQDRITGWVGVLQIVTLGIGLALASERIIGFERLIRAQRIAALFYDWISFPWDAVRYVRAVLLGAWDVKPQDRFSKIDRIDAENLRDSRQHIYANEDLLGYFQETVLTKFAEPDIIKDFSQFETFSARLGRNLTILDIGGGEGEASARFLQNLLDGKDIAGTTIEIDLFENSVLSDRYSTLFHEKFGDSVAVHKLGLFDEQSELRSYDVIILFHSLYSFIDNARSTTALSDKIGSIKSRLEAHLRSGGLIVGSLASAYGQSASFKRKCMMEAFGRTVQDITFEELSEFWKPNRTKIVDTHFKFVGDENGRVSRILGNFWIRYFARLTDDWLNVAQERYLFQHLLVRCTAFEDLSEQAKRHIISVDPKHEELRDRTQFLHHKTGVFLSVKD